MNLPIIETVAKKLVSDASEAFKRYLEENHPDILEKRKQKLLKRGKVNVSSFEKSPSKLWETSLDVYSSVFWSIGDDEGISACYDFFKVNNLYFYKLGNEKFKKSDVLVADFDSKELEKVFLKMGFVGNNFIPFFNDYIKKSAIPERIKKDQIKLIRRAVERTRTEPSIERVKEITEWNLETLTSNFKASLSGTKWYIYFYGYSISEADIIEENKWNLARLVLEFTHSLKSKELGIYITNTENTFHYDYTGKTDFSSSTKKVLVMNLKTVSDPPQRQLNIKLFVNEAKGSFFHGHYSNYEANTGRIIYGDIIFEQVKEEFPTPYIFVINTKNDLTNENEHLDEIEHIIPFFNDVHLKFGSISTKQYMVVETEENRKKIKKVIENIEEDKLE